jgi:hypothetical protein
MRFFVPSACERQHAEEAYQNIREQLATLVGPITDKRIYRLKYNHNGHSQSALVGSDRHSFGNEPVIAIFEGRDGIYYVCTQKNDAYETEPHPVQGSAVIEAEDFSALA